MDGNALRRGLQVVSLAMVVPLAVLDGARSDDKLPAASPRAANETAADNNDLTEDIRQLRAAIRELHAVIQSTSFVRQEEMPTADDTHVVKFFKLQVADVDEVSGLLALLPDVSCKVIGEDKRLAVVAPAGQMQNVAEVIAEADRLPLQIMITAYMYEVPVEAVDQLGLRGTGVQQNQSGWFSLTQMATNRDITELIRALESVDGARLLARPTIITYDNRKATFESVREIPFHQVTRTEAGGQIGTTQFREVGIKLQFTANLGDGQDILLDLNPEYRVLQGFQDDQPIIHRRSSQTQTTLKSGEATVLRGFLRRDETEGGKIVESELIIVLSANIPDREEAGGH